MAGVHLERHIFGSQRGYTTLACSAGLSQADCRELERLSFGTPYDPAYRAGLARNVAYWSRPLSDGRRAITRILPGDLDDEGRPTLLLVTAVLSGDDWDWVLEGDVRPLLRRPEVWQWNRSAELAGIDLDGLAPAPLGLSGTSTQRVLGLISLVELAWLSQRSVVVREEHYSWNEVALVERLLPPDARRHYSAVYRSLNPDLPVSLNCLAQALPVGATAVLSLDQAKSPYARHLLQTGLASGHRNPVMASSYVGFGKPRVEMGQEFAEEAMTVARVNQGHAGNSILWIAGVVAALMIGGVTGWFWHGAGSRPVTPPEPSPWRKLVEQAIGLAGRPAKAQLQVLGQLRGDLAASHLAQGEGADSLIDQLDKRAEVTQLVTNAERALQNIRPNDAVSKDEAHAARRALTDDESSEEMRLWSNALDRQADPGCEELVSQLRRCAAGPKGDPATMLREVLNAVQSLQPHVFSAEQIQELTGHMDRQKDAVVRMQPESAAVQRMNQWVKAIQDLRAGVEALPNSPQTIERFDALVNSLKRFGDADLDPALSEAMALVVGELRNGPGSYGAVLREILASSPQERIQHAIQYAIKQGDELKETLSKSKDRRQQQDALEELLKTLGQDAESAAKIVSQMQPSPR